MSEKFIPRLCPGTVFALLVQAKQPIKRKKNEQQKINETKMLGDFVRIVDPSIIDPTGATLSNNTSQFKACEISYSSWLPFQDQSFITSFDELVKTNYQTALKRVNEFCYNYLAMENSYKYKLLGKQLLELVTEDENISGDKLLYIYADGPIAKNDISSNIKISIQELILGVMHFAISNRIDNTVGKETYASWFTGDKNCQKIFNSKIGTNTFNGAIIYPLGETDRKFEENFTPINEDETENFNYSKYLRKLKAKYKSLRTLLYTDIPHNFFDFYECNDIQKLPDKRLVNSYMDMTIEELIDNNIIEFPFISKELLDTEIEIDDNDTNETEVDDEAENEGNNEADDEIIDRHFIGDRVSFTIRNATPIKLLRFCSNYLIITGTGGLGKSMMMRNLLLQAIDSYNENKMVPLFVTLKDFDGSSVDMFHFLYSKFDGLCNISQTKFKMSLERGEFLLLLDGFDEIHSDNLSKFLSQLETFTNQFSSNMFVISSRPYNELLSLTNFEVLKLMPFSKKQAISLANKLEFRPDMPEIKEKFIHALDKNLYDSHRTFANNPLLLTIMLMTFEQYAEVPDKMHIFYREAFLTLAQKHDASKGAYKRALETGLTADRFSDYLAEFCSRTYADQKFELTPEEFKNYFSNLKEHSRYSDEHIECDAFIKDLTSNMCLTYFEGNKYHFTHRSFQEYFCALYFAKQKDKNLGKIGDFFEKTKARSSGDKTFQMLYDMIPDKMDEYVIYPFLKKKFDNWNSCDNSYLEFIKEMYPNMEYCCGEDKLPIRARCNSFTYNFILSKFKIPMTGINELPVIPEFVHQSFNIVDDDKNGGIISPLSAKYDKNASVWLVMVPMKKVFSEPNKYMDFLSALESDKCLYFREYLSIKELLLKLEEKATKSSENIFDLFD